MNSALALVLTHNAPDALVECVRRIGQELEPGDRLLVVDNESRRPAGEVLSAAGLLGDTVEILRLDTNIGPAGGYARGLERFLALGHDLVWVVDDDMLPEPGALRQLRNAVGGGDSDAIAFPHVTDPEGNPWNYFAWCGVLLPRRIVAAVGLPREEFFWWLEDTEYLQWRIPRGGYRTLRVAEAKVAHACVRRGKWKPAWKYYYETRNTVYFRLKVQLPGGFKAWKMLRRVLRTTLRGTARIVLVEDGKTEKLGALMLGFHDGLRGRLGLRYPVRS